MRKILTYVGLTLSLVGIIAFGASSFTTYYNLEKPADGDSGWGSAYRTTLDTIDTNLHVGATHISQATGAHAATAISTTVGTFCSSAINVQTFLACLDSSMNDVLSGGAVTITGNQTITGQKSFSQNILGNLQGNVIGGVTGDLVGNVTGNLTGDVTGNLTGNVTGNVTGNLTGNVTGNADTATKLGTNGTTTTVLHGNAAGSPSYSSIVNADVDAAAAISSSKLAMGFSSPLSISSDTVSIQNAAADGSTKGAASFTAADFNASSGNISIDYTNGQAASGSVPGFLSSTDWTTFNNKQVAGDYATSGSGDVSWSAHSGSGAVTTAIGNNKVTNAMLAQVATQTFKGRTSGSTGNVEDLTVTQATALLNNFVGDSGLGGTKGLVPAPASGDAAASKFLKADGNWSVPSGAGDVTGPSSSVDSEVAIFSGTGGKTLKRASATGVAHLTSGVLSAATVTVAEGGTGLTSGTDGGILAYTASGTLASSGALTANQLIKGGGPGVAPSTLTAGSQYQVLRMGASTPAYGSINLDQAAAVTGALPVGNGGTGLATGTQGDVPMFGSTTTIMSSHNSAAAVNYSLATSVASSALTITLNDGAGSTPSSTSPACFSFRSSTLATGTNTMQCATGSTTIVISSGSTLGTTSGVAANLYVYAIYSGSAVVLAVANGPQIKDGDIVTSTALAGSGADDAALTLYTTNTQTSKAVRLIGKINISESTAGTWASNATEVSLLPLPKDPQVTYGYLDYAPTSGCTFTSTSASVASYAAVASCPTPTVSGFCTAAGTKLLECIATFIPKGIYEVSLSGSIYQTQSTSGSADCYWEFYDGTTSYGMFEQATQVNTGSTIVPLARAIYVYTSDQSNITMEVRVKRVSGNGSCQVQAEANTAHVNILIKQLAPL